MAWKSFKENPKRSGIYPIRVHNPPQKMGMVFGVYVKFNKGKKKLDGSRRQYGAWFHLFRSAIIRKNKASLLKPFNVHYVPKEIRHSWYDYNDNADFMEKP